MKSTFHQGELEVQARTGVSVLAQRVSGVYRESLRDVAIEFLLKQQMVIVSSVSPQGHVWATMLSGREGFIHAVDERTITIEAVVPTDDPLFQNLQTSREIGLLLIDLATRRRMKVKGSAGTSFSPLIVDVERVYSLCHQYIQARELQTAGPQNPSGEVILDGSLSPEQQALIASSDTFFIASFHPETGADAAHRGGNPGFVKAQMPNLIIFPDYKGNNLFNTLGNITANPNAGLLFLDFENNDTLQLSGQAQIIWESDQLAQFPGAKRLVQFRVHKVIERKNAHSIRWAFLEYSPHNPQ